MYEEMENKTLLGVMDELRDDPQFNQEDQFLVYKVPKGDEKFDGKKVVAIYKLIECGGVELKNKGEEKLSNYKRTYYGGSKVIEYELEKHSPKLKLVGVGLSTVYEFHLKINYGSFNRILKQTVLTVKGITLGEYDVERQRIKNRSLLKERLSEKEKALARFKAETDIRKKSRRWKLLNELSDFQRHNSNELRKNIGIKSIGSMKYELNKNLEGTGLWVNWERSELELNGKGAIWWLDYDTSKIKSSYRAH